MLFPVINAVSKALPKSKRATNVPTLSYCDLEKVPHHVVSNICDWLHIGVLMLGRREGFGKDWLLPVDATLVLLAVQNVDVKAPFLSACACHKSTATLCSAYHSLPYCCTVISASAG